MTLEIALVFAILVAALVVFALDLFPIDFVAFSILALMLILGPFLGLAPEEAIIGFSNPATITVLAMFILSGAIQRTGMVNWLARRTARLAQGSELRQLLLVMGLVGPISAFINNTAVVAILIPFVITLAHQHRRSPSKLLIPLSYTSQLGGVVTLIGTSTNILASALIAQEGYRSFGMFEFSKIGLLIFATGVLYLLLVGRKLLPERRTEADIAEKYQVKDYLTEVVVLENSPLVGKTLAESGLSRRFDIHVLEIIRDGQKLSYPLADKVLQPGDILFIRANREQLLKIKDEEGLALEPEVRHGPPARDEELGLLEVIIAPNSDLIGGTLESTNFRNRYNCTVIAIRKHGAVIRERLGQVRLDFGDTLLLQGERGALEQIKREPGFIVTEEVQLEAFRTEKIPVALAILGGVVLLAALGVPILVTALVGCVLMVLTGCLTVNELHESIRWDVIFLLAGVIPLGLALERTGGAQLLAGLATRLAQDAPPIIALFIFYIATMVLTELISNNAAVVVMVPVGVVAAETLGIDPRAVVLAIMFAASTSFSTPVGYQTNTMVYGPGGYKFTDFLRVGGPLNLLLALLTPLYIAWLWGL
jgi:di/tricarboxylate transporter